MVLEEGASATCGEHVSNLIGRSGNVLVVMDPALVALGIAEPTLTSLRESGHSVSVFSDLTSDPKESAVDAGTALAHANETDCVVGIGGGSALDTAKLIAALAHTGEVCGPYSLCAKPLPYRRTAVIAVPTTSGTGSETTGVSIVSDASGAKNWFAGHSLYADLALMDPKMTVGLPSYWTLYTGLDALVHAIESRTNKNANASNNPTAEHAISLAAQHLKTAITDGSNIAARAGMMESAAFGGLAIANTGCSVAHCIGHALGSLAGIPHGRAVSIGIVASLEWAVEGDREGFERVAEVMGLSGPMSIADFFHRMAEAGGETLALTDEERAHLSLDKLSYEMTIPANDVILHAASRVPEPGDAAMLAGRVLAA